MPRSLPEEMVPQGQLADLPGQVQIVVSTTSWVFVL